MKAWVLYVVLGCVIRATVFLPLPAATASDGQPPLVLTLEDALGIAAEHNRDIQKAVEYRRWVKGKYTEERASAFPQIALSGSATRVNDESVKDLYSDIPLPEGMFPDRQISTLFSDLFPTRQDIVAAELGVSQPLFTWGQIGAAIRAAKVGVMIAEDQLRFYQQATTRDVATAFYDLLLAKELSALAAGDLALKERHAEEARRRNEHGTATDYDVLAATVSVEHARPELIRTHNMVRKARDHLCFLLALEHTDVDVTGTLTGVIGPYPDYETSLAVAFEHRPELAQIEHRRSILRELIKIARAGDKPRLDAKGSYGWKEVGLEHRASNGFNWQVGLILSVPIFDGLRTRGRVLQAKSDLAQLEIEAAKLRDAIALEVRNAVDAVHEAGQIALATSGTLRQAEQLLSLAEKGYEYGVMTHLDVEDAQLKLMQARVQSAQAYRDYRVSRIVLEWATGTLELPPK